MIDKIKSGFFLTKAFVFLLKSCSFSSLLSSCHCWSFLLHMKQNDKFFCSEDEYISPSFIRFDDIGASEGCGGVWLCALWWKTACQMRHGSINLSCWPLHAHRQDKWTLATTTFVRLIESNVHHLLDRSSFLLLMNGPVSWCITFWIIADVLTQETLVFAKVARRKESETLMETVAKDNLRLL